MDVHKLLASSGRRDLVLAVLIVAAGFLIFGWTVFSAVSGMGEDFIQMTAPGTKDLDLLEVGEYTIFYENLSVVGGRLYSTGDAVPAGLEIEVTDLSSGEKMDLSSPKGSFRYSFSGRSGRSIAAFAINHPGTYRMTALYSRRGVGPEVVLAVGSGLFEKVISAVLISSAAIFGSLIIAAIILISAARRREREEERLREEERMIRGRVS
jgi:hypothetical protein